MSTLIILQVGSESQISCDLPKITELVSGKTRTRTQAFQCPDLQDWFLLKLSILIILSKHSTNFQYLSNMWNQKLNVVSQMCPDFGRELWWEWIKAIMNRMCQAVCQPHYLHLLTQPPNSPPRVGLGCWRQDGETEPQFMATGLVSERAGNQTQGRCLQGQYADLLPQKGHYLS